MTTTTAGTESKTFASPDETRTFERGRVDLVDIAGTQIGRLTLQPGWRWSEHVKPIAGTDLCEAPHFQYHVQGTLRIRMADGTEFDARRRRRHRAPPGPRRLGRRRRAGRGRRLVGRLQLRQGLTVSTSPARSASTTRGARRRAGRHDDVVADRLGIRLLGEFRIDGVELDSLRSRQARTLLKRLALERGGAVVGGQPGRGGVAAAPTGPAGPRPARARQPGPVGRGAGPGGAPGRRLRAARRLVGPRRAGRPHPRGRPASGRRRRGRRPDRRRGRARAGARAAAGRRAGRRVGGRGPVGRAGVGGGGTRGSAAAAALATGQVGDAAAYATEALRTTRTTRRRCAP